LLVCLPIEGATRALDEPGGRWPACPVQGFPQCSQVPNSCQRRVMACAGRELLVEELRVAQAEME